MGPDADVTTTVLCDIRQVSFHLVILAMVVDCRIFKEPSKLQNCITSKLPQHQR